MDNRTKGYYHVKYDGDWYIGLYDGKDLSGGDVWYVCAFRDMFYETDLDEVYEKMIPKHE